MSKIVINNRTKKLSKLNMREKNLQKCFLEKDH